MTQVSLVITSSQNYKNVKYIHQSTTFGIQSCLAPDLLVMTSSQIYESGKSEVADIPK